jgi:hypothetical protein
MESISTTTTYHRVTVDGIGVFYREAGPQDAPTIVLLSFIVARVRYAHSAACHTLSFGST